MLLFRTIAGFPAMKVTFMAAFDSCMQAFGDQGLLLTFSDLIKWQWRLCRYKETAAGIATAAMGPISSGGPLSVYLDLQGKLLQDQEPEDIEQRLGNYARVTTTVDDMMNVSDYLVYGGSRGIGHVLLAAWTQRHECRSAAAEMDLTSTTNILVEAIDIPMSLKPGHT
jgi:hypothetical protein